MVKMGGLKPELHLLNNAEKLILSSSPEPKGIGQPDKQMIVL
jgi:hypothetical protein